MESANPARRKRRTTSRRTSYLPYTSPCIICSSEYPVAPATLGCTKTTSWSIDQRMCLTEFTKARVRRARRAVRSPAGGAGTPPRIDHRGIQPVSQDVLERMVVVAEGCHFVQVKHPAAAPVAMLEVTNLNRREPLGAAIREGVQHAVIHHAENNGGSADTQGEREYGNRCEPRGSFSVAAVRNENLEAPRAYPCLLAKRYALSGMTLEWLALRRQDETNLLRLGPERNSCGSNEYLIHSLVIWRLWTCRIWAKTDFLQHRLDLRIRHEQLPHQPGPVVLDHDGDRRLVQPHKDR